MTAKHHDHPIATNRIPLAQENATALAETGTLRLARIAALSVLICLALSFSFMKANATEIQRVVSDAGIEAWLVEDHTVPIVALNFSFSGGNAQDEPGKEGGVTMLTSLLDEGAGDMESEAFLTTLEENAIKFSFDASRDRFHGSVLTLTPNKGLAFDLLAKALQKPRFDADPIERMRSQWISSARQTETNPHAIAGKAFREAAFPGHPYETDADGTPETLAAVTRDDLVRLHKSIMTRNGLIVGVVGAIDAEELKAALDQIFAPLPASGNLVEVPDVGIARTGEINVPFNSPQTTITFGCPGVARDDPDFYAAYIVNYIMGGGSFSSRLFTEIREKRGLAYNVSSYLTRHEHADILMGGMATRTGNDRQAVELVKQEFARMAKEGPTQKELDDAKKYLIGNYPLRFDNSTKIARQLVGIQESDLGIDYFDKRNSYVEGVTLEDAKRAAKRLFDPSKMLIVTVGQEIQHAQLSEQPVSANDNAVSDKEAVTN